MNSKPSVGLALGRTGDLKSAGTLCRPNKGREAMTLMNKAMGAAAQIETMMGLVVVDVVP